MGTMKPFNALTYEVWTTYGNGETEIEDWFEEAQWTAAWDLYDQLRNDPPYDAVTITLVHLGYPIAMY